MAGLLCSPLKQVSDRSSPKISAVYSPMLAHTPRHHHAQLTCPPRLADFWTKDPPAVAGGHMHTFSARAKWHTRARGAQGPGARSGVQRWGTLSKAPAMQKTIRTAPVPGGQLQLLPRVCTHTHTSWPQIAGPSAQGLHAHISVTVGCWGLHSQKQPGPLPPSSFTVGPSFLARVRMSDATCRACLTQAMCFATSVCVCAYVRMRACVSSKYTRLHARPPSPPRHTHAPADGSSPSSVRNARVRLGTLPPLMA